MRSSDNLTVSTLSTPGNTSVTYKSTLYSYQQNVTYGCRRKTSRLISIHIPDAVYHSFTDDGHFVDRKCVQDFNETVLKLFRNTA